MEKITKLATIVATAARMEKKAKTGLTEFEKSWKDKLWKNIYYRKQFETVMNYITEEEAKSLCEELEIEHKNQSYKQDLLGKMGSGIDESERIAYLVVLYFIDENKAQEILDKMELQSSKKSNLNKKASMADIEIKIKQEKDYFMVYMGTVDSSGIKKKCKNTFEIVETLRNYVENRIMESK